MKGVTHFDGYFCLRLYVDRRAARRGSVSLGEDKGSSPPSERGLTTPPHKLPRLPHQSCKVSLDVSHSSIERTSETVRHARERDCDGTATGLTFGRMTRR